MEPSATKHGITEDDARHTARHALRTIPQDDRDPYRLLVIGVDRAGTTTDVISRRSSS